MHRQNSRTRDPFESINLHLDNEDKDTNTPESRLPLRPFVDLGQTAVQDVSALAACVPNLSHHDANYSGAFGHR